MVEGVPITTEMINAEKHRRATLPDVYEITALCLARAREVFEQKKDTLTPGDLLDLAQTLQICEGILTGKDVRYDEE